MTIETRPNEWIDVEKEAEHIALGHRNSIENQDYLYDAKRTILALIARVRAETEAEVTRRERERAEPVVEAAKKSIKKMRQKAEMCGRVWSRSRWTTRDQEIYDALNNALAAYESNDAGIDAEKL